jgi:hypothetical protein
LTPTPSRHQSRSADRSGPVQDTGASPSHLRGHHGHRTGRARTANNDTPPTTIPRAG